MYIIAYIKNNRKIAIVDKYATGSLPTPAAGSLPADLSLARSIEFAPHTRGRFAPSGLVACLLKLHHPLLLQTCIG